MHEEEEELPPSLLLHLIAMVPPSLNAPLKMKGTVFIVCARLSNTVLNSHSSSNWKAARMARWWTAKSTTDSSTGSSWTSVPGKLSVPHSPPTESGPGSDGSGLPLSIFGDDCGLGAEFSLSVTRVQHYHVHDGRQTEHPANCESTPDVSQPLNLLGSFKARGQRALTIPLGPCWRTRN